LHSQCGKLDRENIRLALSRREKAVARIEGYTPAAVLIPLYERDGDCHLVFTRRTEIVNHHKGQISFPGGGRHFEDRTLMDTALRESWEEIGLNPEDAEVLGELDDIATYTTNFVISPFVAAIPYPYEFRPSPYEVGEIIEVPLSVLVDKNNFSQEVVSLGDQLILQYFYRHGHQVIYGATARILKQFLEIVSGVPGSQRSGQS
jgi:8-oxo-dGTP pyrophosphatase MutT (NUDIX family)